MALKIQVFERVGGKTPLLALERLTLSETRGTHCVISLLIPFEEDVCTFLIFSYSFIGQQLLLKQFCSNRLSFKDSLLTSTANPAQRGRTGCAG